MAKESLYIALSRLRMVMLLLTCVSLHQAAGHTQTAQQPSGAPSQPMQVSLAHLYWHFLIYQNYLDTVAANQPAQSWLRNDLQAKMQFSDADFAPIRTSSRRLSANVKVLDAQAAAIHLAGVTSNSRNQLKALTGQREAAINAEIAYLAIALSTQNKARLEAFLVQFFSPNNAVRRQSPSTGQTAPAAVQP